MIKHRYQPNNKTCGQTSMAMVLGITPEEAIKLYGHNNATYHSEHIKILKSKGYDVDEKFTKVDNRKKYELPKLCIVRVSKAGKRIGHMIVHYKGKFYDPSTIKNDKGIYDSKEHLFKSYPPKWRIESYLEIKGKARESQTIHGESELMAVAGKKKINVRLSHDITNKGYLQYINRIVTEDELNILKNSKKFNVVSFVEIED